MQQYEGLRMLAPVVAEIQQSSRTKPKKVHIDKLKKFEGEEPAIWPAAANRLAGRQDTPSSNERSNEETEEAVWATGEVHFGSAESADGPTTPLPVLGVVAESTDESTTPPPITIQLERNRPDLLQDWTDGKRTPAGAESMETAGLKEFHPLADCLLDTAENYLQPATGSTSPDTGSSDIQVVRNLPDQSTASLDIRETGSLESQNAENLEAAIVASSTARTPVHAAIYPNSGSISPIIITGNKSEEQLPVTNLGAMEESDRLERGDRETTITTNVADDSDRTSV